MGGLFLPRLAGAHTPGLSVAEFTVQSGGRVDARMTFASAESLQGTALNDADLAAFVRQGIDVTADGARCPGVFQGASPAEVDGLVLQASYDCAADASAIEVTLYYLSSLPPGHREVARIVADGASTEAVLTGSNRELALHIPATPASSARRARSAREAKGRQLIGLTAAFTAIMLGLVVWRWRATRKTLRR